MVVQIHKNSQRGLHLVLFKLGGSLALHIPIVQQTKPKIKVFRSTEKPPPDRIWNYTFVKITTIEYIKNIFPKTFPPFLMSALALGPRNSRLNILLAFSALIFIAAIIGGVWYDNNAYCFRFFGCNAGFFGYDILEHFSGGLFSALAIVRLALRFPRINIFHNDALKIFW